MALTSDEDADVRDWATFGLGTQINVDGTEVRQCLLARLDDPDEDTRSEAIAGLARRHVKEVVQHIRHALRTNVVGRLAVRSAGYLGDPSFAEPLAQLLGWWDVDVDLLESAARRCDPARIDATAALVKALLDAAEAHHRRLSVSSELLEHDDGEPVVHTDDAWTGNVYGLDVPMRRADGSIYAAVQLIEKDLAQCVPRAGRAGHRPSG